MNSAAEPVTEDDLRQAFACLLGDAFGASAALRGYELYYAFPAGVIDVAQILRLGDLCAKPVSEAVGARLREYCTYLPGCRVDLRDSLFIVVDDAAEYGDGWGPVPFEAFAQVGRLSAGGRQAVLTGLDVATLAFRFGIDPGAIAAGDNGKPLEMLCLHVATDSTLLGALTTATGAGDGSALRAFADLAHATGPHPAWADTLNRIEHPALREHLATFCLSAQDARREPWYDVRTPDEDMPWSPFPGTEPGGLEEVVRWSVTDGDRDTLLILRSPPLPPRRRAPRP